MDWQEFAVITTAASTFATALSSLFVLWLRRRTRAEPDWAVMVGIRFGGTNADPLGGFEADLVNAGDGPAFRVTTELVSMGDGNGSVQMIGPPSGRSFGPRPRLGLVALIAPGEDVRLQVRCARVDWGKAELVVTWTASPTRLGRRQPTRIPLRQIAEPPSEGG